ncbi:hypothetical protein MGG_08373 [Pyricularia oryzae 70-15]|uniref:Secreted protein n=3 Tax=Pyricularia oryzae TaxID=318829 RepID=G4MWC0_PYRO7|nr:uncharacterized protein MGG_08373 [Pyricularia oryzae 70-15]EHA55880.1 hypothetical protein MGG_08373 [Pyricularia oryzae 70-15]ELQ32835.1 hypothetical protein OOU_Y34scaffold01028g4 [Pyricularia oryzae Y34]KAI7910301.1 hypothetical protein M9X92_011193 [Pyricularia oryzae]KAI7913853.1 hypothetical protein M0657_009809 [Pyricularia oryzae]
MQFSALLVTFAAATVSAIDVRGYVGDNCGGAWVGCANLNPNVCCTPFGGSRASVGFAAIPTNWRIRGQAFTGGGCNSYGGQGDSNGRDFFCLPYTTRGDRTGGSYSFVNRKRAIDETCPAEQPLGRCEATVKPDTIGLADGTEYNITSLSEDQVNELSAIAASGAGVEAVPANFQVLRRSISA